MIGLIFVILGLVIGSFISALTFRYPKSVSIINGRSFCDSCRAQISWYDNIPLLSFLMLKGKCRKCDNLISYRYPLIEFVTALGFYSIYYFFWPNFVDLFFYLLVFTTLISIFVIDLENKIIPDDFTFWGIFFTTIYLLTGRFSILIPSFFAGFALAAFLLFIHLVTKGRGMGLGDVKFAVFGGIVTGPSLAGIWLLNAFLTGGIAGIILILAGRAKFKDQIAFGPFLVAAIPITLIWGQKIIGFLGLR